MNTVELIVTRRYIGEEGHRMPGDLVAVSDERARDLIESGVARVNAKHPPSAKKKSSIGRQAGRSTRTPSSKGSGSAAQ